MFISGRKRMDMLVGMYSLRTTSGEGMNGMSFQGADEELLREPLQILQDQGKMYPSLKEIRPEEDGIVLLIN
jgi:hypothetical protein